MRQIIIVSLFFSCMVMPAMAETQAGQTAVIVKPMDDREQAEKLLVGIFDIYRNYSRDTFSALVSENFAPARAEFIDTAEKDYAAGAVLELNFFIDQVLPAGKKLAIQFKWEKKTKPGNLDHPILRKGFAQFMFENVKGKWLLGQVIGNSPF
ncbi:MAG: hypothetical protein WCO69_01300 [Candidatus Omnitrophota bacterium]